MVRLSQASGRGVSLATVSTDADRACAEYSESRAALLVDDNEEEEAEGLAVAPAVVSVVSSAANAARMACMRVVAWQLVCVRLASTERATARVMHETAARQVRHQPRCQSKRHLTASRQRRNSKAAAHPRPEQEGRARCGSLPTGYKRATPLTALRAVPLSVRDRLARTARARRR